MTILNGNDEILLLTILALKKNAYGATIMQHLTEVTGREWSIGAVYDPLHRLEKTGFVRSGLTSPTPERGGRSKRVYEVTKSGLEALAKHREVRQEISRHIPDLIFDLKTK
jgi:PadR family transcriptional regulator PadR